MKIKLGSILFFVVSGIFAQQFVATDVAIPSEKITVNGTLVSPINGEVVPLVIIIPGSGTTDRDGNSGAAKSDYIKALALGLAKSQIASYRYDKSSIAAIKIEGFKETDMSFDDFIVDAKAVVKHFKQVEGFSKIVIFGHSQGSLVGMLAAQEGVDGYISGAGAARTIDKIITEQVMAQSPLFKEDLDKTFAIIADGKIDENFNPLLASLFRKTVQPFWGSWMKYNPSEEIKKLQIPVLIINGTNDIQVAVDEAKGLKSAYPNAKLVLIKHMNHVFKKVTSADRATNIASYTDLTIPIMLELIKAVEEFVMELK